MDTKIFSFLILLLLAVSCVKQDHNNPFDSQCPKELWTPTDFKATLEGTTVKLTWSQSENRISGFKLTKKVDTGTETALTNQSKDANQLTDASLTGGKVHVYTLVAYAGNNQSNVVTTQITPTLPADLTTTAPSTITSNSAIVGGTITTDGGLPITERGICWATTTSPTTSSSKLAIGTGSGIFSNTIAGLLPATIYYFRAYAINSKGTAYGNEVTATTLATLPTLTTTAVSAITSTTASGGGNITSDGGSAVTARGVCWSITQNPTTANSKTTSGTGSGVFTSNISGLVRTTTYYIRAYATNSVGTSYGGQETLTTSAEAPVLTTTAISAMTNTTASSGGNITSDGGSAIIARGVCWATTQNPTTSNSYTNDGTGTGTFSSSLTGLLPGTTYYVKAYATNSVGISYGNQISLTTSSTKQYVNVAYLYSVSDVLIDTTQWHYYVITKANNLLGQIYIDGQLIRQGNWDNSAYNYYKLYIGAYLYTSWDYFFKGWLDELRVSKVVRTSTEIAAIYNSNSPVSYDSNTVGLWHFNESSGTTFKNENGTNGVLYNGVQFVAGKFSNALYFDGRDDRGDCFLDIPESNITIEFWAKLDGSQISTVVQPFGMFNSGINFVKVKQ